MFDLLQSKPTKLVVASLLTAGMGTTMGSSVLAGSAAASSQTIITVNNNAGEPLTNNFNPLVPTSTLDFYGSWSMIYEPLVQYDVQKPGVTYPWLAASWKWSNGNKTLVFELRHGVKWSDGQPFTSKDVVFTFDLMKKYPSVNLYGLDFTSVTAQGAYQVTMKFPASNYTDFYYAAELSPIIPDHIWSTISNPATYADTNPIGTGPSSSSLSTPRTSSSSPTRATGSAACPRSMGSSTLPVRHSRLRTSPTTRLWTGRAAALPGRKPGRRKTRTTTTGSRVRASFPSSPTSLSGLLISWPCGRRSAWRSIAR